MSRTARPPLRWALPEPLFPGEEAIRATGIGVTIGDAAILRGVDVSVRAGEVVALIGPNGAGKSTLLGAITGDVERAAGEVALAGRLLEDWHLRELAQRRSVLLQQNEVFFPFSVQQVVEMGRSPWRRTEREDQDEYAVERALLLTDVLELRHRQVPSLSGGERARVALARILAQGTGIMLLDEPTAALDLRHQEDVLRLARAAAAEGDAVIVVLHDLNLAAAYADTVTLLQDGAVVTTGTPSQVLTAERITEVYRYPVEVMPHPASGVPVVLPIR